VSLVDDLKDVTPYAFAMGTSTTESPRASFGKWVARS